MFLAGVVKIKTTHFRQKSFSNSQNSLIVLKKSFQPCRNGCTEREILSSKLLTILHTFLLEQWLKTIRSQPTLRTKLGVEYYRLKRVWNITCFFREAANLQSMQFRKQLLEKFSSSALVKFINNGCAEMALVIKQRGIINASSRRL